MKKGASKTRAINANVPQAQMEIYNALQRNEEKDAHIAMLTWKYESLDGGDHTGRWANVERESLENAAHLEQLRPYAYDGDSDDSASVYSDEADLEREGGEDGNVPLDESHGAEDCEPVRHWDGIGEFSADEATTDALTSNAQIDYHKLPKYQTEEFFINMGWFDAATAKDDEDDLKEGENDENFIAGMKHQFNSMNMGSN